MRTRIQPRRSWLCCILAGASLLAIDAASAQSASDSEKIERLQRQTELLQKQLKALQEELSQTKKKTEKVEAVQAGYAAQTPTQPGSAPFFKAPPLADRVKITLGGFVAAESVFRTRSNVDDMGTNFNTLAFPFSPLYSQNEFHGFARQSRISLLAEGDIDPVQKLSAYWENDWGGVAANSNYNQSNSWALRLRQAYATYDNSNWGFHFLGGQAWSLLTPNTVGIVPRKENIPLTIDASYVVGFDYTRQWQLRAAEDFGNGLWLGVSVENPATIFAGNSGVFANNTFTSGSTVNGLVVNFSNTGSQFLNTVSVSTNQAPDVIEKAAWDPGWGHYEVFGLQRFFYDNTFCAVATPTGCVFGTTNTKTTFGEGVGGSVLLPVIPKYLDLQANGLYGSGVGRYGAAQLPDVTINPDGSLSRLTGYSAMVGAVGHPWEGLDLYAYAGIEQVNSNYFSTFGYGNPLFNNTGCLITTATTFAGTTPTTCVANTHRIGEITAGFWQNVYKGDLGRLVFGAQYAYVKRDSFTGVGGAPSTDDNIVYTSFRYYPF